MWENLLASWRQSEQKKDHCPSLLNHNAKYKRLLPPCYDFANGVRRFLIQTRRKANGAVPQGSRMKACDPILWVGSETSGLPDPLTEPAKDEISVQTAGLF